MGLLIKLSFALILMQSFAVSLDTLQTIFQNCSKTLPAATLNVNLFNAFNQLPPHYATVFPFPYLITQPLDPLTYSSVVQQKDFFYLLGYKLEVKNYKAVGWTQSNFTGTVKYGQSAF